MPNIRIKQSRTVPSPGSGADKIQTRVVEYDASLPLPMGAVVVDIATELTPWADESAAPDFSDDPNRTETE